MQETSCSQFTSIEIALWVMRKIIVPSRYPLEHEPEVFSLPARVHNPHASGPVMWMLRGLFAIAVGKSVLYTLIVAVARWNVTLPVECLICTTLI